MVDGVAELAHGGIVFGGVVGDSQDEALAGRGDGEDLGCADVVVDRIGVERRRAIVDAVAHGAVVVVEFEEGFLKGVVEFALRADLVRAFVADDIDLGDDVGGPREIVKVPSLAQTSSAEAGTTIEL